ncbi:MAG: hypothetical protein H7210_14230 [Pyrinomonadaceae bacterium]|nr:hypothetical protein [Phycisphaerales bacterium]
MKRRASVGSAVAILLTAVPFAIACSRVVIADPGSTENYPAPCSGMCSAYLVCPVSDQCLSGYISGVDSCGPVTRAFLPCHLYVGGSVNASGCCTGGMAMANGQTVAVIRYNAVGGVCGQWPFY